MLRVGFVSGQRITATRPLAAARAQSPSLRPQIITSRIFNGRCEPRLHLIPSENPPPAAAVLGIRGACPHDCPDTCGLVTTVENGVATRCKATRTTPHRWRAVRESEQVRRRTYHPRASSRRSSAAA